MPKLRQRPDITRAAAAQELQPVQHRLGRPRYLNYSRGLQRLDQRIDLTASFKPPEDTDGALARLTGLVSKRLHQLRISPGAGLGQRDEHGQEWSSDLSS
jgi:hypothetical protein